MFKSPMTVIARAAVLTTLLILQGCATPTIPLQRVQTNNLSRESQPQDVEAAIGKSTPTAQFEMVDKSITYGVRQFNLQTGMRTEMTMLCTPTCIPYMIPVPVMTQYLIIQRLPQRSLLASGTLEELSKDPDPTVSDLMPAVKQRLAALAHSK